MHRISASFSFRRSPRYVDPAAAGRLRQAAKGRAKAVAVTVDADNTFLDQIVAAMNPDMLQLHGKESVDRVKGNQGALRAAGDEGVLAA